MLGSTRIRAGRCTSCRFVQPLNTAAPISVTESGIRMLSMASQFSKARLPIFSRESGSSGRFSLLQPEKACSPMDFSDCGK